MFSMVIVEISAESVKACSFHQRKSIPDTEIIILRLFYEKITQLVDNILKNYAAGRQYPAA